MSLGNWLKRLLPSRRNLTPKSQRKSAVLGRFQSVESLEERIVLDGEPPMNGPPSATPDSFMFDIDDITEGTVLNVLENDTDPDNDGLTILRTTPYMTMLGSRALVDGEIHYNPPSISTLAGRPFVTDVFYYYITDGQQGPNFETGTFVTIQVGDLDNSHGLNDQSGTATGISSGIQSGNQTGNQTGNQSGVQSGVQSGTFRDSGNEGLIIC